MPINKTSQLVSDGTIWAPARCASAAIRERKAAELAEIVTEVARSALGLMVLCGTSLCKAAHICFDSMF